MKLSDKLSANFKLSEFCSSVPNEYQICLLRLLASNLQKVRNFLNEEFAQTKVNKSKDIGITVNNGLRSVNDYMRLLNNGYNPSKSSDHFFGFAPYFAKPTLGAADIIFTNTSMSIKDIFKEICKRVKEDKIHFGQVIIESSSKSTWIHVGNDWNDIFKPEIEGNTRKKFLISEDNGITFSEYKP